MAQWKFERAAAWVAVLVFAATGASHAADKAGPALALPAVKSWHYQLQGVDPGAIALSSADMALIHHSGEHVPSPRPTSDACSASPTARAASFSPI